LLSVVLKETDFIVIRITIQIILSVIFTTYWDIE